MLSGSDYPESMRTRTHPRIVLRTLIALPVALLATFVAGCADFSDRANAASVVVSDGWARATEGTTDTSMTAAFMNIDNPTDTPIVLVGASSPVAPMVQLHEMVMQDGVMTMQQMQGGLTIEANRGKTLAPGGNHIMLMGLTETLAPGDEVSVTLQFQDGSTLPLTLPVKAFTEEEPHYHATESPGMSMSSGGM